MYFFFRFLEHFILNGPDPKALDAVLKQLSDPNRKSPQELDKAIIGIHNFKLLLVLWAGYLGGVFTFGSFGLIKKNFDMCEH